MLEEVHNNDTVRVQDKYECLLREVWERAERAENQFTELKKEQQVQVREMKNEHKE